METIKITKSDLNNNNEYLKEIGSYYEPEQSHLEIDENLGTVNFKCIYVTGSIFAKAGSGIKAGEGIEAGDGIKAGSGIEAGSGIKAGDGIEAGSRIKAGDGIEAGKGIISLHSFIKARLKIISNVNYTIVAGCFSTTGKKEIEAQEIIGNVAYGVVKLLPKE
jgi:hypothetical protein